LHSGQIFSSIFSFPPSFCPPDRFLESHGWANDSRLLRRLDRINRRLDEQLYCDLKIIARLGAEYARRGREPEAA
jgi:hypothetical protein